MSGYETSVLTKGLIVLAGYMKFKYVWFMNQVFWSDDESLQDWQKEILRREIKNNSHGHEYNEGLPQDSERQNKENNTESDAA